MCGRTFSGIILTKRWVPRYFILQENMRKILNSKRTYGLQTSFVICDLPITHTHTYISLDRISRFYIIVQTQTNTNAHIHIKTSE